MYLCASSGMRASSHFWSGLPKLIATFSTAVRMMRQSASSCWARQEAAKSLSITAAAPFKWCPSVLNTGMPPPPQATTTRPASTMSRMDSISTMAWGRGEATTRR